MCPHITCYSDHVHVVGAIGYCHWDPVRRDQQYSQRYEIVSLMVSAEVLKLQIYVCVHRNYYAERPLADRLP